MEITYTMVPCIICDKQLKNVAEETSNQPYSGTCFNSYGHYGSTIFDPMDGSYLEINVCDECLANKKGSVLHGRNKIPVTAGGSYIGSANYPEILVRWFPESNFLKQIDLKSWAEYEEFRKENVFEPNKHLTDSRIKEIFEQVEEYLRDHPDEI